MEDLTFMEVSWGDVIDLRDCIYLIVCSEAAQSRTLSYVYNVWEFLVNDTLVLRVLNELLLSFSGRIFTLNSITAQFVVPCSLYMITRILTFPKKFTIVTDSVIANKRLNF